MPLPWKNNNVPRISRIVADLQSPKRGGSLVVETGFPTSLIDLFVKNRSRFKRRKSKRLSDPFLPPPAPPPSPPEYLTFDDGSTTVMRLVQETTREAVAQSDRVVDGSGFGSGPEKAVFAILKILTAIVLTLSVKKLTVGITMSAFALLFLEFVGKHIVCRLDFLKRTRSNAITAFSSLSRGISCCFRKNCEQEGIIHEEEISGSGLVVGGEVVEIEVVEPNDVDANINFEATDSLNRGDEWICSEMKKDDFVEQDCEISECSAKGKRCHKLKSKMMKILVPRKLRSSKEEKKEKKSKNKEAKSNSEKLKDHISKESTKDKDGGIICSRDSSMAKEVVALMSVREKGRRESESSGYVMLIVIALAGLGGGKILALVFIMAWCFILKLVRNRGRSVRTSFS